MSAHFKKKGDNDRNKGNTESKDEFTVERQQREMRKATENLVKTWLLS